MKSKIRELAVSRLALVALILGLGIASPAAGQLANALEQELIDAGWSAQRSDNGDLILRPPSQRQGDAAAVAPAEPAPRMEAMQQQLRKLGWGVEQEADGSLLLRPPALPVAPAAQASVAEQETAAASSGGQDDLAEALRARNWQVERAADGSLIVRRPTTIAQVPRTELDFGCGPWTAPLVTAGEIALPVDEWGEARQIAGQWVDQVAHGGLLVGKIRKLLKVYLVSIVAHQSPFELRHQLAIRSEDGRVVLIY